MATMPIITVRLEASQEREAIARFIEWTYNKNWIVQDVLEAIRNGSYLEHVSKLVRNEYSPEPVYCPECNRPCEGNLCANPECKKYVPLCQVNYERKANT